MTQNIAIGTLIAVTNKIDNSSCYGTYQGIENGRLVVHTIKGGVRSFSTTSGLWLVRSSVKNLI